MIKIENILQYNVEMNVVSDTNKIVKPWDCGLKVICVNTVGLTNATINEYLKLLTDRVTFNKNYPITSEIKESLVTKTGESMCEWLYNLMEDARKEGRDEGFVQGATKGTLLAKVKAVDNFVKVGIVSLDKALEIVGLTKAEYDSVALK